MKSKAFIFALAMMHLGVAHSAHDPKIAQVYFSSDDTLAVCDELDEGSKYFEIDKHGAPLVNWAIASALSLDVGLHVKRLDDHSFLVAGVIPVGRYLIDARYVVKERNEANDSVEYYFVKAGRRLKVFDHKASQDSEFLAIFVRASLARGFIDIRVDSSNMAGWTHGEFDPAAWNFTGNEHLTIQYIPTNNLVAIQPNARTGRIPLRCIERNDRQDTLQNFYVTSVSRFKLTGAQKNHLRRLETQREQLGGTIFCINTCMQEQDRRGVLHIPDICLRTGPQFMQDAAVTGLISPRDGHGYTENDVRRVLWLSVNTRLPQETFSPLELADGTIILPAIGGDSPELLLTNIGALLDAFSAKFKAPCVVAIPINYLGKWIAIVIDRGEHSTRLTFLHSMTSIDRIAFLNVQRAVTRAFDGERFLSPRITSHHIQPVENQNSDGLIMVENLLRHLGFGGPTMPLVMLEDDVKEVRRSHEELLRLHGEVLDRQEEDVEEMQEVDVLPSISLPPVRRMFYSRTF